MKKRSSLNTMEMATAAKKGGGAVVESPKTESALLTIRLRKPAYDLLRTVALKRAAAGGRFSISAVIGDLAEKHRSDLEREK